jgi:hypothetical protein
VKLFCFIQIAAAIFASLAVGGAAGADVIAQWNFDTLNLAGPQAADNGPYTASAGTGNASGHHVSTATKWTSPQGNGSIQSYSADNWNIGDYWQISASTTGYTNITLAWDQAGANAGPRDFKLQYSADGNAFTDFGAVAAITNEIWSATPRTISNRTADLGSIAGINNLATVYFRIVDTSSITVGGGQVMAAGLDKIDNFTVFGTSIILRGDINQDGVLDVKDIAALMTALTDLTDYQSGTALIPGTDNPLRQVATSWDSNQLLAVADVNKDNAVNNLDIQAEINLVANMQAGLGVLPAPTVVPEPSSITLGLFGALAGIAVLRKRDRSF